MSSRDHTRALVEYLRGVPELASIVFDGRVPGAAPPEYVLVFAQSLEHDVDRMAGRQRGVTARHTIHSISTLPSAAQHLADRVSARLVGARIPVPGRSSSPVKHVGADPMRLDSSVPPAVYFLADDYEWATGP